MYSDLCIAIVAKRFMIRRGFVSTLRGNSIVNVDIFQLSLWQLSKERPTWCHLLYYLMLNMFRMLIHSSSGACDLCAELFHRLYWSVRIEVFALARLFCRECLVVTCVVVLESVFLKILAAVVSYDYRVFLEAQWVECEAVSSGIRTIHATFYCWLKKERPTCFIISLFNAQHVSDVNTSILRSLWLTCWVISWVLLLTHKENSTTTRQRSSQHPQKHWGVGCCGCWGFFVCEQYNPWNNSTNESQAPEDGCINIRNMLSIK